MRAWISLLVLTGCDLVLGLEPHTIDSPGPIDAPIDAAVSCTAIEVRANAGHVCARRGDRTVSCWGNNSQNENGTAIGSQACSVGTVQYLCTPTPVSPSLPPADRLGLADQSSCAIVGGDVYCWGTNGTGEIGGPIGNISVPKTIPERAGTVELTGGKQHLCGRMLGGEVRCAGQNEKGEVGTGTMSPVVSPTTVALPGGATSISTGYQHSCAVVDGDVWCWGSNDMGQASGSPSVLPLSTPTRVPTIISATLVAAGASHTCALRADGTVACWGSNEAGQLGDGTLTSPTMPVASLIADATSISAGVEHTCALLGTGQVTCWGASTLDYSPTPDTVPLPRPAIALTSGSYHDCAIVDDGSLWCWGWGAYGQLGDGTLTSSYRAPRMVKLCGS